MIVKTFRNIPLRSISEPNYYFSFCLKRFFFFSLSIWLSFECYFFFSLQLWCEAEGDFIQEKNGNGPLYPTSSVHANFFFLLLDTREWGGRSPWHKLTEREEISCKCKDFLCMPHKRKLNFIRLCISTVREGEKRIKKMKYKLIKNFINYFYNYNYKKIY